MKIGLLGGSFDPIHNGHLKLGRAARRQLGLDRVYFVLSPRSPFKLDRQPTPASFRYRLLAAALRGERHLKAADWELRRRGPSYTISTLRRRKRTHPSDDLYLVMGSDALAGFPRWKSAKEIARLCTLVAGLRPGAKKPARFPFACRWLKGRFPDVSSTEIRRRLARGRIRGIPLGAAALLGRINPYRSDAVSVSEKR